MHWGIMKQSLIFQINATTTLMKTHICPGGLVILFYEMVPQRRSFVVQKSIITFDTRITCAQYSNTKMYLCTAALHSNTFTKKSYKNTCYNQGWKRVVLFIFISIISRPGQSQGCSKNTVHLISNPFTPMALRTRRA